MFMTDKNYQIRQPTSQFFAAQLITQEWVEPKDADHRLFKAASDVKDAEGNVLVTAYAALRPDGQWSLLLINKDHDHAQTVSVVFHDGDSQRDGAFEGPLTLLSYGRAQYQWHPARKEGYADPDDPPARSDMAGGRGTSYTLPAASINVLRGRISF